MARDQTIYSSLVTQTAPAAVATKFATHAPTPTSTAISTSLASPTETPVPWTNTTITTNVQAGTGRGGIITGSTIGLVILVAGVVWIVWKKRVGFFNFLRLRGRTLQAHEGPSTRQNQYRPLSYQQGVEDELKGSSRRVQAELEVKSKTPRLTLGPFGNHPPFPLFTRTSVVQIPPYTPSAEFDKAIIQEKVTRESNQNPEPAEPAISPVELPATPVSFTLWEKQRNTARRASRLVSMPPRISFRPFTPFSITRKPLPPEGQGNLF